MATWHQTRAPHVKLSHPTQWTVVVDTPNALRHLYSVADKVEAEEWAATYKAHRPLAFVHILPPDAA